MILHYCVYVLQSEKDRLLYHGYTINLLQRLKKHTNWEDVFVAAKPMKFNAFNTGLSTVKLKTYADTTSFPENVDIKMVLNCDILAFSFKHPQKGELG